MEHEKRPFTFEINQVKSTYLYYSLKKLIKFIAYLVINLCNIYTSNKILEK